MIMLIRRGCGSTAQVARIVADQFNQAAAVPRKTFHQQSGRYHAVNQRQAENKKAGTCSRTALAASRPRLGLPQGCCPLPKRRILLLFSDYATGF